MKKLSTEVTLGYSEIIEALPSDVLPPGTMEGPHRAYPPSIPRRVVSEPLWVQGPLIVTLLLCQQKNAKYGV
jgi:hypothetical protein